MNIYLVVILTALIGEYVLRSIARYLNLKALDKNLPEEFKGFYDAEKYRQSQHPIDQVERKAGFCVQQLGQN